MATNPTAQWWLRSDGVDTNGGGYDSGISGAATNYCNQAAAQATFTVLTLTVTTNILTDTGGLGLFTAAMIGNSVNVPGQGYYWITAFTNSNVVTVALGTGAASSFIAQPGKVGGALRNPYTLSNGGTVASPGTTTSLVPGNQVNIRAAGGSVGSPEYTQSGFAQYPGGNSTDGYISWVGYNGMPFIKGDGLMFFWPSGNGYGHSFTGIYFTTSGSSNGTSGLLRADDQSSGSIIKLIGCTVDANNIAVCGVGGTASSGTGPNRFALIDCTLIGSGSSSLSGFCPGGMGASAKNCLINGWNNWGIQETATAVGVQLSNNIIVNNAGGGIKLQTTSSSASTVDGCTIDSNSGDGVQMQSTVNAMFARILNNNITNNSAVGIKVASGTATANTSAILYEDYNNVYNNTSGQYSGLNGGAHDLNVNPSYV